MSRPIYDDIYTFGKRSGSVIVDETLRVDWEYMSQWTSWPVKIQVLLPPSTLLYRPRVLTVPSEIDSLDEWVGRIARRLSEDWRVLAASPLQKDSPNRLDSSWTLSLSDGYEISFEHLSMDLSRASMAPLQGAECLVEVEGYVNDLIQWTAYIESNTLYGALLSLVKGRWLSMQTHIWWEGDEVAPQTPVEGTPFGIDWTSRIPAEILEDAIRYE